MAETTEKVAHTTLRRNYWEWSRKFGKLTGALSLLLDEQLEEVGFVEREKCRRRQLFMEALHREHLKALHRPVVYYDRIEGKRPFLKAEGHE